MPAWRAHDQFYLLQAYAFVNITKLLNIRSNMQDLSTLYVNLNNLMHSVRVVILYGYTNILRKPYN
jgi:hypothetical protein